jgi:hypothetical protein
MVVQQIFCKRFTEQRRVQLETQAVNGSRSTVNVSIVSKDSLVFAIKDDDWKNQINSVFGGSVGKEFGKVLSPSIINIGTNGTCQWDTTH